MKTPIKPPFSYGFSYGFPMVFLWFPYDFPMPGSPSSFAPHVPNEMAPHRPQNRARPQGKNLTCGWFLTSI